MFLKEGKAEVILGIFFAVLGLLLLLVIIPSQIAYVEGGYPQPRFFPNIIAALITVLGAALAIGGFRKVKANKEDQEVYSVEKKQLLLVLITLGVLIVYVASMYFIPYLPATIVVTGVLVALYGQKSKLKIILTAVIVPVIIYVAMTYGLQVRLP